MINAQNRIERGVEFPQDLLIIDKKEALFHFMMSIGSERSFLSVIAPKDCLPVSTMRGKGRKPPSLNRQAKCSDATNVSLRAPRKSDWHNQIAREEG